jgi:hypothetical protein
MSDTRQMILDDIEMKHIVKKQDDLMHGIFYCESTSEPIRGFIPLGTEDQKYTTTNN